MKKMKLSLIFLTLFIFNIQNIFASIISDTAAPATITMGSNPGTLGDRLNGPYFPRKRLSNGTEAYCISTLSKEAPDNQILYIGKKQGAGYTYILRNGYPNKSASSLGVTKDEAIYATQTAIWWLQDRVAGISDTKTSITSNGTTTNTKFYPMIDHGISFKSTVNKKSTALAKLIYNLVNNGEKAQESGYGVPTTTIKYEDNDKTLELTEDKKYWESKYITVKSTNSDFEMTKFKVSIESADAEIKDSIKIINSSGSSQTTYTKSGDKFKIRIPVSALPADTTVNKTIKISIKETFSYYAAYSYYPKDYSETGVSSYQNILPAILYPVGTSQTKTTNVELTTQKLKIIKRDATTKEALSGASLSLLDSSGKEIDTWETTDEPYYIYNLDEGEYTLVENRAPEGYQKIENYKFKLENNGTTKTIYLDNNKNVNSIKISKQDITTKEEIPGAKLEVRDSDNNLIDSWTSTNEPHFIPSEKFIQGKTYRLIETIAPNNYQLSTSEVTFIVGNEGIDQHVIMYNELNPTTYKISKKDITTKEELPGANLVIYDSNNEIIESWVSEATPHEVKNLPKGKYILKETIAPTNYKINEEVIEFEVLNDGTTKEITMYNELNSTTLEIIKRDITNDEPLKGATLVIKDALGNEIETWETTKEAHYIKNLETGTYTIEELSAPEGYSENEETITIDVTNDGNTKQITIYNTPLTPVPITALNFPLIVYIIGLIALIVGGILLYLNEKKKI